MSGTEHTRPMRGGTENFPHKPWPRWRALERRENVQFTLALKQHKADLDMHEQLRDLGSERDWYALNTVGVHLRTDNPYAEWEVELLGARIHEHTLRYTTTSVGYGVGFDPYFVERTRKPVIVPVIQGDPIVVTESNYARNQMRKHQGALAKRKRTLTNEQRREILRRESVSVRGFSRV